MRDHYTYRYYQCPQETLPMPITPLDVIGIHEINFIRVYYTYLGRALSVCRRYSLLVSIISTLKWRFHCPQDRSYQCPLHLQWTGVACVYNTDVIHVH